MNEQDSDRPSFLLSMRRGLIHFIIIPLLVLSWFLLQDWYRFWSSLHGWLFAATFSVALGLIAGRRFWLMFRQVSRLRSIILLAFVLLCLPWGEWFQLALPEAREDWTRQIFLQTCFLYGLSLLFSVFPVALEKITGFVRRGIEILARSDYLLWLPSFLFFLISCCIAIFVLGQIPGTEDSAAHLFQAKVFSKLRLFAPSPPVPDFFDFQGDNLVIHDGKWFSMYFPGFALLLAPAVLLRAEWFVSPILGALTLAIWIRYIRRWHNRELALFFSILFLCSPFLLLMSSAMMVHAPELLITSLIFYLVRSIIDTRSASIQLGLFLSLLAAMVTRPFSILVFVSPALLYLLYMAWKRRDPGLIIAPIAGGCAGAVLVALYQWKTTGSPWLPAYLLEIPNCRYGFGMTLYDQIHTPARGLENVSNLTLGLNSWLTRWDSGVIFYLLLFLLQRKKTDPWDGIFLWGGFGLVAFQFCFVGQDLAYGPRYFYLLSPVFLLYVVRTSVFDGEKFPGTSFATATILISLVIAGLWHSPKLIRQHRTPEFLRELARSPERLAFLAEENLRPVVSHNDPFLSGPVLYCVDLRERNPELARAFPDHQLVYFRTDVELDELETKSSHNFSQEPDEARSGVIDLFQLASMLNSEQHPDRDWFDLAYRGLISTERVSLNQQYLKQLSVEPAAHSDYRSHFRAGLISAGLLLAQPAFAYSKRGRNWKDAMDTAEFRRLFSNCDSRFEDSGPVGSRIRLQLSKVRRRIDQDHNGLMTDNEILSFLALKIRLLEKY